MSVDVGATVNAPFSVAELLAAAGVAAAELVGLPAVPVPRVVLGRMRFMGQVGSPGREPEPGELDRLRFGAAPDAGTGTAGPGPNPAPGLPEIDVVDEDGDDLVVPFGSWSGSGGARVFFTPRRDPVGLVWALAFAVAAGRLGRGRLVDDDLRLTDPPVVDPDAFVAAVRRPVQAGPFPVAAREFLGQFDEIRDWLGP